MAILRDSACGENEEKDVNYQGDVRQLHALGTAQMKENKRRVKSTQIKHGVSFNINTSRCLFRRLF